MTEWSDNHASTLICRIPPAVHLLRLAEGGEGFEEVGDALGLGAAEGAGELLGGGGRGRSGERGAERLHLVGQGFWPGLFF